MSTAPEAARPTRRRSWTRAAVVISLFLASPVAALAAPRVVATVKPLHSLVAGVMTGIGAPDLLIRGGGSPHTYSLNPSAGRLLERAQVIFWIGGSLEAFMEKPLAALGANARIVTVTQAPGIVLLPARAGGRWDEPDGHEGSEHGHATQDGHLWLDPANARVIARLVADVLGQADPENRGRYAANADALVSRIDALDFSLKTALGPVRDVPFVVFHDAYQYFEKRYALRAVGSIAVSPERAPGARRVQEIRDRIRSLGVRCVFSEPQFSSAIIGTLLEGTNTRAGTLDPLGAGLPAGPDAYFTLMHALGSTLATCLGAP